MKQLISLNAKSPRILGHETEIMDLAGVPNDNVSTACRVLVSPKRCIYRNFDDTRSTGKRTTFIGIRTDVSKKIHRIEAHKEATPYFQLNMES